MRRLGGPRKTRKRGTIAARIIANIILRSVRGTLYKKSIRSSYDKYKISWGPILSTSGRKVRHFRAKVDQLLLSL